MHHHTPQRRCDLFCQVIDNFGDAGVCWRLACQLAEVTDWKVRLVIDQPSLIALLEPKHQRWPRSLEVVAWGSESPEIADIVIEAFACHLPDHYLAQMRSQTSPPVWVNVDYLSAESWIDDCHGLPSPDPQSGIAKYFFFPGFSPRSGGLIREASLDAVIEQMRRPDIRREWLKSIGIDLADEFHLVSLFAYADSSFDALFRDWQADGKPVHCLLPAGLPEKHSQKIIGNATLAGIRVSQLPFLPQNDYDRLLAACDFNFVRGEDSFVRAQWIGKPFVWQAYRQTENTHHLKVAAFLDRYQAGMPEPAAKAVRSLHQAWNGIADWSAGLWSACLAEDSAIADHNAGWAKTLVANGNLAENLAVFCRGKL